jgi:hypothetical protein
MRASPISIMLMTLVVIASACGSTPTPTAAPPTSAPTQAFTLATSIKDIMGTWHNEGKGIYLRFYEDGTLHQSHSLGGLDNRPYAISEVWFEGTQIFLKETAVSGVPSCGDTPGIYEVRLLPDGKIRIVRIKEKCSPRAGDTALQYDPVR